MIEVYAEILEQFVEFSHFANILRQHALESTISYSDFKCSNRLLKLNYYLELNVFSNSLIHSIHAFLFLNANIPEFKLFLLFSILKHVIPPLFILSSMPS